MPDSLQWIETLGGPHLLASTEALHSWHGVEGWRDNGPDDPSDYARACRAGADWLGRIPSPGGDILVFGGDVGAIAWLPDFAAAEVGVFVQWLGCDSEEAVLKVLEDRATTHAAVRDAAEVLEFNTGPSGAMVLFDASESGSDQSANRLTVALRSGRYRLAAYFVRTDDCMVAVRELRAPSV
jgi:hypothetical protein